jgi:membrane fusion protein (multidrug efflux system)
MQKKRFKTMRFMILMSVVLALTGCSSDKSREDSSKSESKTSGGPANKPVLVELDEIQRGMIEQVLERSAALEAEAQVQVLARTQNPAIELLVEEGDKVSKGQVLLRLEDDRQRTDNDQALSDLNKSQIDFETEKNLYEQQLISESAFRTSKATYDRARFQADTAQRQLEYTEVRAPINGTVTSRTVKVGDQVNTQVPIFEIIDLESTVAIIHVPEQYLPKLRTNMMTRITSSTLDDEVFPGYVKRISPVVDAGSGTIKVVVGVKELGALRPGMWVDVELVLDSREDAILIPKRSIVYDNDQTFAFKVYTDTNGVKRAKRWLVEARNVDKVHIEPADGFEVGERIVVAGQGGLKDDSPVRELEASGSLMPAASDIQTNSNAIPALKKTIAKGGG